MKYLKDLWDESQAQAWANDQHELLRYRSNLLGADLRLTNFGGGNTSAKFELPDPFTGKPVRVLGVKGSGGDLGTAGKSGFALCFISTVSTICAASTAAATTKTRWWLTMRWRPSGPAAWRPPLTRLCTRFCPSSTLTICTRTGASRSLPPPTANRRWRNSTSGFIIGWFGSPGSGRDSTWGCACARPWTRIPAAMALSWAATESLPGAIPRASAT